MLPICLYLNYSFVYIQSYSRALPVTAETFDHQLLISVVVSKILQLTLQLLVLLLQPAYGLFQVQYFRHKA